MKGAPIIVKRARASVTDPFKRRSSAPTGGQRKCTELKRIPLPVTSELNYPITGLTGQTGTKSAPVFIKTIKFSVSIA